VPRFQGGEELAAARLHGGRAVALGGAQQVKHVRKERGVLLRDVREALQGEGPDDGACGVEAEVECCHDALPLSGLQPQARQQDGEMPLQFVLGGFFQEADEGRRVGLDGLLRVARESFKGVGCAHADGCGLCEECVDYGGGELRLLEHEVDHLCHVPCGAAVTVLQESADLRGCWHGCSLCRRGCTAPSGAVTRALTAGSRW
jgi:hypothetical protein